MVVFYFFKLIDECIKLLHDAFFWLNAGITSYFGNFEIVLKILGDALVQVYAGVAHHVVLLARVGKEVRLCASLYTGIKETQAVLWYHGVSL